MKLFKLADLAGQVLMLITGLALYIIPGNATTVFPIYYLVGGWQVTSMLIHELAKPGWRNQKERRMYVKFILWTFVIGVGSYIMLWFQLPAVFLFLVILLLASPLLAIWYFSIGLTEWKTIRNRELIHLKR